MPDFPITTRTVEERGVVLPWKRVERYGPPLREKPKGTVLESGEVFVSMSTLYAVNERTSDDYLREIPPPFVGYHEELALVEAGLADKETRGGIHGTEKLAKFLREHESR